MVDVVCSVLSFVVEECLKCYRFGDKIVVSVLSVLCIFLVGDRPFDCDSYC